jgi:hypothetical protein
MLGASELRMEMMILSCFDLEFVLMFSNALSYGPQLLRTLRLCGRKRVAACESFVQPTSLNRELCCLFF